MLSILDNVLEISRIEKGQLIIEKVLFKREKF